jgi:hypothetical protein
VWQHERENPDEKESQMKKFTCVGFVMAALVNLMVVDVAEARKTRSPIERRTRPGQGFWDASQQAAAPRYRKAQVAPTWPQMTPWSYANRGSRVAAPGRVIVRGAVPSAPVVERVAPTLAPTTTRTVQSPSTSQ